MFLPKLDSHCDPPNYVSQRNLSVILICISFMTKDVENFFMYLLVIFIPSENSPFSSFAHLLIGLICLLVFNFWSSLYIMDINPLFGE
jgi:hypothetical protein